MPLETYGTTPVYIGHLNDAWPAPQDAVRQGYQHLQLIKTALKATFPSLSAAVTLTADDWEDGTVPRGSRMVFYQGVAPIGWTRIGPTDSGRLRIVETSNVTTGGSVGGVMEPAYCEFVPAHSHGLSNAVAAGAVSAHAHQIAASLAPAETPHDHDITASLGANAQSWHVHSFEDVTLDPIDDHTHDLLANAVGVTGSGTVVPSASALPDALLEQWETDSERPLQHVHDVTFTTAANAGNKHTHLLQGETGAVYAPDDEPSPVHRHTASAPLSALVGGSHSHNIERFLCDAVSGAPAGTWKPRCMEMIICQRG